MPLTLEAATKRVENDLARNETLILAAAIMLSYLSATGQDVKKARKTLNGVTRLILQEISKNGRSNKN